MTKTLYYIIGENAGEPAQLLFTWTGEPEDGITIGHAHGRLFDRTYERIVAERIEPE